MENICCIYLIKHKLDEEWENVYIGSTCNYKRRHYEHIYICNKETNKNYNDKVYQYIRENGNWENFEIIVLEECEKDKLKRLEQSYMDVYKPTLNCYNANGMKLTKKEADKISYEKRKERINKKNYQKFDCECGGKYTQHHRARHFKSKKHQAFITKNKI